MLCLVKASDILDMKATDNEVGAIIAIACIARPWIHVYNVINCLITLNVAMT